MVRSTKGLALASVMVVFAAAGLDCGKASPAPPVAPSPEPIVAMAVPAPPAPSVCPEGMILVEGNYCDAVEQKCLNERPKPRFGCLEFEIPSVCTGEEHPMRYCIDDYEYPNQVGEKPAIMKSWYDADRICRSEHKRVCKSQEWTLACEGPERWPFPYGYIRDSEACHIDERGPMINEDRFYSVDQDKEIERIDRREPAGARPGCVSPYGVHDLTGNVDEWTTNETGIPDHGALKGGNWGEWRNACRPMTLGHAAWFRYYQLGFRCCTDAPAETP